MSPAALGFVGDMAWLEERMLLLNELPRYDLRLVRIPTLCTVLYNRGYELVPTPST